MQVQTFGEGVKVSPGTREAEFSSRDHISDPLDPLKMNVLGPDYRQVRLRRGQNDAVRQGQLEVVTEPGGFEGQGGQGRDLTLVHGGRGLEGRILAPLLENPFKDFEETDGRHQKSSGVLQGRGIKVGSVSSLQITA